MSPRKAQRGAILAVRVSDDRSGRGRSPEQQDRELEDVCADNGWAVKHRIQELSISASEYASKREQKAREEWLRRVLAWAANPDVDVLLGWEISRLGRDPRLSERLIDGLRQHGVDIGDEGRVYDLNNPSDLAVVRHAFTKAAEEAGKTSQRVRRDNRAAARAGRPHGGRPLYGYSRLHSQATGELLGQKVNDTEAAIVVEVFQRFAAGEGPRRIASDLNARGVPMPTVAERDGWYDMRLRKMLANPAYIGQRVHQGAVQVLDEGVETWEAIIEPELWNKVQARLGEGAGMRSHSRAAKHLVSGLARCFCGAPMYRQPGTGGRALLKCINPEGGHKRGHNNRDYEAVEAYVLTVVVRAFERSAFDFAEQPDDPATVEAKLAVKELRAELDDLDDSFHARGAYEGQPRMKAGTYGRLRDDLEAQLGVALRRIRQHATLPPMVFDLMGPGARQRWDALDADVQRTVLDAVASISVLAGVRGQHTTPETLEATVKVERRY